MGKHAKTHYLAFSFVHYVNGWRWMKHALAGRRVWCGISTGNSHGGKPLKKPDGTDRKTFEADADTQWKDAWKSPESRRQCMAAIEHAFTAQSAPPGVMAHCNTHTLSFLPVNRLYPRDETRPQGVTDDWNDASVIAAVTDCEQVSEALQRCVSAWAAEQEIDEKDWRIVVAAGGNLSFRVNPEIVPDRGSLDSLKLAVACLPETLEKAHTVEDIVREATRTACASFFEYLRWCRANPMSLRRCQHQGCDDFFVTNGGETHCGYHSTNRKYGKSGSNKKAYAQRKEEWDRTKGDRDARAVLLAHWHNVKKGSPNIAKFLSHGIARNVTGVTCSFASYKKLRKTFFAKR